MSIYTVNGKPVKYDNKWLAQGGAPSSDLPPYDSTDAGKALVVNNEGDAVEWQTVGSTVVVDQHYDGTSTNAQSGTAVAEAVSTKQDTISDLSDIRSGAALGATAVQPSSLATVATSGSYADLSNKPTIPTVDQVYNAASANAQSGVAVASAISGKQDTISDLSTIRSGAEAGATAVQPSQLATVATSGSYADLSNTPTIPAAQVNSDWTAVSGVSQILNKPTEKALIAGTGITITETAQGIVISLAQGS